MSVTVTGDRVVATVSGRVPGPGGLFDFVPGAAIDAEAVAAAEDAGGAP